MKLPLRSALGSIVLLSSSLATAEPILRADASIGGFVGMASDGPLDTPTLIGTQAEFESIFGAGTEGLANPYLAPSVAGFFANGGTQAYVVRVAIDDDASLIGVDGGPGSRTGLQAFLDVDQVAIVAIPGATSLAVQQAVIAHCEATGDRIAVLDPASVNDIDAALAQRASLTAACGHAALYFPWVQAEPTGASQLLPPSGFVAGIYSRTSPSESPLGSIGTATGVSLVLSSQQSDMLNQAGVSSIRLFAGPDVRVWGARTVSSDPDWKYVFIRRTALFLEESIRDGTQWALFEPNDETLWVLLRQCVEDFLLGLWQEGWFQGSTPQAAFFVRVDETTMTQEDIDEGRTILHVGFAPLQPSEFLVLRIVLQREESTSAPASLAHPPFFRVAPNPFATSATIEFELPHADRVNLRIYDTSGRLLRTLFEAELLDSGTHGVVWDGRSDRGERVASGVYLSRIDTASVDRSLRVLVFE